MHGFYKMICRGFDLRWNVPSLKSNFSSLLICSTSPPWCQRALPGCWVLKEPFSTSLHMQGISSGKGSFVTSLLPIFSFTQGITHSHRCTRYLSTHHRAGGMIPCGVSVQNPGEGSQMSFSPIQGMRTCSFAAQ